jgi:hypothetical protein
MLKATNFATFYEQFIAEDNTSAAFGSNSQYYNNMGEPNADHPQPNDMRLPKILGAKKKIGRRSFPETVFLTGKVKKTKKK